MQRVVLLIAIMMMGSVAHAEADRGRTQRAMETYFSGEISGGYVLMGMGASGLAAGGLLLRQDSDVARGMSYPLLGIGVGHLAAGIFVAIASKRRVDKFTTQIHDDAPQFLVEERPRMKGVSRTFTILKVAECVLIAGGIGTALWARRNDHKRLEGVGYGVALEAGATLVFDIFAAARAHDYRDELAAVDTAGGIALMFTHGGAF